MKGRELAYALGISAAMVSKLTKRGMPTHSIEEAEKWRKKNLDPMRVKPNRADGNQGGRRQSNGMRPLPVGSAAIAQAVADDPHPFDTFMRDVLPASLFNPLAIAAVMSDAAIRISGVQALRLSAHLFLYYIKLVDPSDEMGRTIPPSLEHRPGSPEFKAQAERVDEFMATVNRT